VGLGGLQPLKKNGQRVRFLTSGASAVRGRMTKEQTMVFCDAFLNCHRKDPFESRQA
jgi:hypothetical protein